MFSSEVLGGIAGDLGGALIGGAFNAHQASKNRAFQRQMSNTAYQRAARDLDKAGLNRIIALGNPASTPSGATAAMDAPRLGSTGIAAASAKQQIAQSKAQEKLFEVQQHLAGQETALKAQQTRIAAAQADKEEVTKAPYEFIEPLVRALQNLLGGARDDVVSNPGKTVERIVDSIPNSAKTAGSLLFQPFGIPKFIVEQFDSLMSGRRPGRPLSRRKSK